VALPLAIPVVALVGFFSFVANWTNYFLPWVMYGALNTTGRYPVALGIAAQLIPGQTSGSYLGNLQLTTTTPPAEVALLILVTSAPVLVVFVFAQRWIGAGRLQGVFG
jgi:multiple sugar transport system permease protein